jgi:hypothetical protein
MVTSQPSTTEKTFVDGPQLDDKHGRDTEKYANLIAAFSEAGVLVDADEENFIQTPEGELVYVDDFMLSDTEFDLEKLTRAIETRLTSPQREQALAYLERARQIHLDRWMVEKADTNAFVEELKETWKDVEPE